MMAEHTEGKRKQCPSCGSLMLWDAHFRVWGCGECGQELEEPADEETQRRRRTGSPPLVAVHCGKCNSLLAEVLLGSLVCCPKCRTWSGAEGGKEGEGRQKQGGRKRGKT